MKKMILAALAATALVAPAAPAAADDLARAGVSKCGGGAKGFYVWWYDLDNQYNELNFCIYTGP